MIGSLAAFHSALVWSTLRAVVVAALGVLLAIWLWRGRHLQKRPGLMGLLLLPLFVPDLPVGYMWRLTAMRLTHSEVAIEVLYAGLLLCRATAIQLLVLLILPGAAAGRDAIHSWKLTRPHDWAWWAGWLRLWIGGPLRAPLVAWAVGTLSCFQEFEIAALMQVDDFPVSWTVWLFDAQGKGEVLDHCLVWMLQGAGTQVLLLMPVIMLARRAGATTQRDSNLILESTRSRSLALPFLFVAINVLMSLVRPVWMYAGSALAGFQVLWETDTLGERVLQILRSLVPSLLAAVLALQIARKIVGGRSRVWLVLLVPGLCGALFVSLSLVALFQLPAVNVLWDSWFPMILGQVAYALPRAWLLVLVLRVTQPPAQIQSAALLTRGGAERATMGRRLLWRLKSLRWLLATALLTHWCFWDVTVISTLRPVYFEPVVTRLYDEMHYHHVDSLMAWTVLAIIVPLFVVVLAGFIWHSGLQIISGEQSE